MSETGGSIEIGGTAAAVDVTLDGEFDQADLDRIHDAFVAIFATRPSVVELDLGGVTFLGSAALGALLDMRSEVVDAGGVVRLVTVSPVVARLLEITGTAPFFPSETANDDGPASGRG